MPYNTLWENGSTNQATGDSYKQKSCNKEELTIKKRYIKNKENSDHKWESKDDNQEDLIPTTGENNKENMKQLIHVEDWQKTTKFCKAIILQLKNK